MANEIQTTVSFKATGLDRVVADVDKISSAGKFAKSSIDDVGKSVKSIATLTKLNAVISGFTAIGDAAKGVSNVFEKSIGGLVSFVDKISQSGDRIAKASRLVGLSSNDFQGLRYAASLSGIEIANIDGALKKFNVNVGKASSGNKEMQKAFSALHINPIDANTGKIKNTKTLLMEVADAYTKLESSSSKAFVSTTLFGESGLQMSEMLSGGSAEIERTIEKQRALGGSVNENDVKNAERFNDSLTDVNIILSGIQNTIGSALMPALSDLFDAIAKWFEKNGDSFRKILSDTVKKFIPVIEHITNKIPELLDDLKGVFEFFGNIVEFIGPANTIIAGLGIAITSAVIPAVVALGAAIVAMTGVATATLATIGITIGLIIAAVVVWGKVIYDIYDNWDMLKSFIVDDVWGAIKNAFSDAWNWFYDVFVAPFDIFFSALPQMFSDLWDGFKSGVVGIIDVIKGLGTSIYKTFADIGTALYNQLIAPIFGWFQSMFDFISKGFETAFNLVKKIPVLGSLFGDEESTTKGESGQGTLSPAAAAMQDYSTSRTTTTTSRFSVDFSNLPRGVKVTSPANGGDYDFSTGYAFGGGF